MRCVLAGVGEAFDPDLLNVTAIIEHSGGRTLMLDCGFTAPWAFQQAGGNIMELDAIWISHFHGDHFLGMPALVAPLKESGRTKPLTIIGQPGLGQRTKNALQTAYPNILEKLPFELEFVEIGAGDSTEIYGFRITTARSEHGVSNLAARVAVGQTTIYYSGDGSPNKECLELARDCDLMIQEAYTLGDKIPGHGNVESAIEFAQTVEAGSLAVVHVHRDVRRKQENDIITMLKNTPDTHAFLPRPGHVIDLKQTEIPGI